MPRQHENDPHMNQMNNGQMHQISAEIGALKASVELMTDMWRRQEEAASSGRKVLHDKLEAVQQTVGAQISSLSLRVDRVVDSVKGMKDTMAKVEPAVKKYEDEKMREEGAKRLGKGLIAALTASAGAIGWGLHEFIGYIRH
jgi:chromosome segregation ATPase